MNLYIYILIDISSFFKTLINIIIPKIIKFKISYRTYILGYIYVHICIYIFYYNMHVP